MLKKSVQPGGLWERLLCPPGCVSLRGFIVRRIEVFGRSAGQAPSGKPPPRRRATSSSSRSCHRVCDSPSGEQDAARSRALRLLSPPSPVTSLTLLADTSSESRAEEGKGKRCRDSSSCVRAPCISDGYDPFSEDAPAGTPAECLSSQVRHHQDAASARFEGARPGWAVTP